MFPRSGYLRSHCGIEGAHSFSLSRDGQKKALGSFELKASFGGRHSICARQGRHVSHDTASFFQPTASTGSAEAECTALSRLRDLTSIWMDADHSRTRYVCNANVQDTGSIANLHEEGYKGCVSAIPTESVFSISPGRRKFKTAARLSTTNTGFFRGLCRWSGDNNYRSNAAAARIIQVCRRWRFASCLESAVSAIVSTASTVAGDFLFNESPRELKRWQFVAALVVFGGTDPVVGPD